MPECQHDREEAHAACFPDPIDAGALVRSRVLEWLASLWIGLAVSGRGRGFAFRLVTR